MKKWLFIIGIIVIIYVSALIANLSLNNNYSNLSRISKIANNTSFNNQSIFSMIDSVNKSISNSKSPSASSSSKSSSTSSGSSSKSPSTSSGSSSNSPSTSSSSSSNSNSPSTSSGSSSKSPSTSSSSNSNSNSPSASSSSNSNSIITPTPTLAPVSFQLDPGKPVDCGTTCRETTAKLTNTGGETATNTCVILELYNNNGEIININGGKNIQRCIGDLPGSQSKSEDIKIEADCGFAFSKCLLHKPLLLKSKVTYSKGSYDFPSATIQ